MTSPPPIRILSADDHPVIRDGVAAIIATQPDMQMVGEAGDGAQAVETYRQLRPDVALIDIQMPVLDGVQATQAIRKEYPAARIVILTTYSGDVRAVKALKAGAAGYLLKSALRKELIDTIRAVHAGRRHVPAEIAREIAIHTADDAMTEREIAVLQQVAAGKTNKEIARILAVSEDTVKAHLKSIFLKLDVADRTLAVTQALRRGVILL
jgi:DNA-binding NarL/FixJ family response regulator